MLATGSDLITVGQGSALSLVFLPGSSLATGLTCVALCGLFASSEAHSTVSVTLSVTATLSVGGSLGPVEGKSRKFTHWGPAFSETSQCWTMPRGGPDLGPSVCPIHGSDPSS